MSIWREMLTCKARDNIIADSDTVVISKGNEQWDRGRFGFDGQRLGSELDTTEL